MMKLGLFPGPSEPSVNLFTKVEGCALDSSLVRHRRCCPVNEFTTAAVSTVDPVP
jgi:hypothetical protein